MMERKFHSDEFEELLRQKTDQYKMYPSENVWKEIFNSLHTRRRRFIAGMSVLVTGILIFAGKELLGPARHPDMLKPIVVVNSQKAIISETAVNIQPFAKAEIGQPESVIASNLKPAVPFDPFSIQPDQQQPSPSSGFENISPDDIMTNVPRYAMNGRRVEGRYLIVQPDMGDADPSANGDVKAEHVRKEDINNYNQDDKKQINWLEESALQHLVPIRKSKFAWQLYLAPTVNYRQLSGFDYSSKPTIQNVPIAPVRFGNINDFVDHSPAVGYEVGGSILYKLTRNLTLKAGLQFNYSRYIIKAFFSPNTQLGTIAFNSYYGYVRDSITHPTNVNNLGGKSQESIQNKYYQLSVPIGIEMRVIGNGRLQFNVGGSIQPTYQLNRNTYLLTTDFVNYTKEPSLIRRWNVNGGLEAFVSYAMGKYRVQLGPQFRYQLLSTYTDKYPFKENLMEYGLKIGITKSIP
ncbi:MAG: hypothetical protein C5B59_11625 [Bacteroidetes bacterium]|nr:MAG: hypothetical protein C5B59_11625 [Bacteroidota bacterium]